VKQPLFRPEVAAARRTRLEGHIVLSQSAGARALTYFLVIAVALTLAWLVMGRYNRTETASGLLVTDRASAKVVAMHSGLVAELPVREGQHVEVGEPLAIIRVEQGNEVGGSAIEESLTAIEAQRALSGQQASMAVERAASERIRLSALLAGYKQQRLDLAGQMRLQKEVAASSDLLLERIGPAVEKGFISKTEVERRRQAALLAHQQLGQLQQQYNALLAQERQTGAELTRVEVEGRIAVASAHSSGQAFTEQSARIRSERAYTIKAPIGGTITAVQTAPGRMVEPSVPLMIIVPDDSTLHADIYAPSRAIGFVKPGQEVRLLYDAFPYQRFGSFSGKIVRVSQIVLDPREVSAPLKIDEPVYRIEVVPTTQHIRAFGQTLPLQSGMRVTANIVLDRRSFWDWFLQPLNAVLNRNQ
jgi:membrane fusion protein